MINGQDRASTDVKEKLIIRKTRGHNPVNLLLVKQVVGVAVMATKL